MKKDFFTRYAFRILFIVVFLLSFVWMGTKQTIQSNSNSVEDWLPAQYQQTQDYKWFLEHFPFESFVVISWDGCTLDDDKIELFAQKLVPEQTIDNFSLMASTTDLKAELDVEQLQSQVLNEIQTDRSPLLQDNAAKTSTNATSVDSATPNTTVAAQEDAPIYFKSVMTGPRLVRLLEQSYSKIRQSEFSQDDLHNIILEQLKGTLIGPDGKSTALIVTLNKGYRDGKSLKGVLKKIREISVECGLPNTMDVKMGSVAEQMVHDFKALCIEMVKGRTPRTDGVILGGPPVDNVALDYEGERTLFRLAGLCALIGITVAMICFRDLRLTMFIFWIALLSAGIALAFVSLTGGTCDSILLSMPALVYVLAMSGSIHLINYYHDTIREKGLPGATERAVQHAFTPCFFAQLTTAIGLGSLFVGRLVPITKFGFYSAVGVLTTLLLLFFYLPALLYFYPSKKFAEKYALGGLNSGQESLICRFWGSVGGFIVRHHNLVAISCVLLMAFFCYNLPKTKISVKMMNFFTPDAEIISHYGWLEEKLGPLVPMELVVSFDNSKLSPNTFGTSERLRLINDISYVLKDQLKEDVGGTISVATFAPDIDTILDPDSRFAQAANVVIKKTIDENRDSVKDYLTIEGNPTLTEIEQVLIKKRAQWEKEYQSRRDQLAQRMSAEGLVLEELEEQLATKSQIMLDTVEENPTDATNSASSLGSSSLPESPESATETATNVGTEAPDASNPVADAEDAAAVAVEAGSELEAAQKKAALQDNYIAEVHHLKALQRQWNDFERICQTFQAQKELLESSDIHCLNDINASLDPSSPYKTLSLEEVAALCKAGSIWQEEYGIELWRISIRVWALKKDIDYSAFIDNVKGIVEPLLKEHSDAILVLAEKAEGHSETFVPRLEGMGGLEMSPTHQTDQIYPAGISAKYTGMVPLVYKTQHELINGLVQSLVMAFVLIAIVFMFILRSVPAGIIAMLPNLFPVVIVFGYMAWRGILVDVGTMMTASVALGVAVDDTMHYLTWFSDNVNKGATPKEAAVAAYRRCATAMTQSTMIAGLGLSAFMFSTFVPTQRFGLLMLAILLAALVGDLLFLPAILTSPIGRFFIRSRKIKKSIKEEAKTQA